VASVYFRLYQHPSFEINAIYKTENYGTTTCRVFAAGWQLSKCFFLLSERTSKGTYQITNPENKITRIKINSRRIATSDKEYGDGEGGGAKEKKRERVHC
jgi:hypothetical protein